MIRTTPIYISSKGGSIVCFIKASRRLFQSCSGSICRYSFDLHSAKRNLNAIESNRILESYTQVPVPKQPKTTLKWNKDGELSAIDKARILNLLVEKELTQCELNEEVA